MLTIDQTKGYMAERIQKNFEVPVELEDAWREMVARVNAIRPSFMRYKITSRELAEMAFRHLLSLGDGEIIRIYQAAWKIPNRTGKAEDAAADEQAAGEADRQVPGGKRRRKTAGGR